MPYLFSIGGFRRQAIGPMWGCFFLWISIACSGQSIDSEKPVPILSGSAGAFSFVTGGQNVIDTQINPVLLVPLGDRWLVEARAEFESVLPAAALMAVPWTSMLTMPRSTTSQILI
jgi:hypothetical protein